jgi:hypothetical protein
VAEQLGRAEQELERHIANLERLKESLANQVATMEASCGETRGEEGREVIGAALSRLQAQIKDTNTLISRIEAFRNDVDEPVVERSSGEASIPGLWGLDGNDMNLGASGTELPEAPLPLQPWGKPSTSPGSPST